MKWDEIWETFKTTGLKIATNLVLILLVFLAAHIILVIISRYTGKAIERAKKMEDEKRGKHIVTLMSVSRSFSRYLLYFFAILLTMNILGFGANVNNVLVTAGVGSLVLTFGAQSFIRDVVAGLFIVFERQYSVGDFVKIGEYTGTVTGIATRVTYLSTFDGTRIIIPNGQINSVINYGNQFNLAKIVVPTPYDANTQELIGKIESWLKEYYEANKEIFVEEPKVLGVSEFGASSVDVTLIGKVQPLKQWQVERDWRLLVKSKFDAEGISIPFQTITVHEAGKTE
ncbi:MAG: mechanosensitive ion channel family protein [Erysipelotrichales bacterium]|nr:mechanosensitive ion channel family protein [Erysipelotrichales bacterium]